MPREGSLRQLEHPARLSRTSTSPHQPRWDHQHHTRPHPHSRPSLNHPNSRRSSSKPRSARSTSAVRPSLISLSPRQPRAGLTVPRSSSRCPSLPRSRQAAVRQRVRGSVEPSSFEPRRPRSATSAFCGLATTNSALTHSTSLAHSLRPVPDVRPPLLDYPGLPPPLARKLTLARSLAGS